MPDIEILAAQQTITNKDWFQGTADAVYQNLNILRDERPDIVAVFGADHIYRMDVAQMFEQHVESGAGVTVAGMPVPLEEATQFGVIEAALDLLEYEQVVLDILERRVVWQALDHLQHDLLRACHSTSDIVHRTRRSRGDPARWTGA